MAGLHWHRSLVQMFLSILETLAEDIFCVQ